MTKHTDEFSQFTEPVTCRECTLPRDEKSTDPKGWIRGNTKIGPVLEVTTSCLQGKYGVEIRIESVNKDNSHSWVRISHGLNKLVTDLIDKENDDDSLEFGKACEDLSWNHSTSTPHRSETNGIAERAVRRSKEGTCAVLLQSGLGNEWCADSMECYTCLRNISLVGWEDSIRKTFWRTFKGPIKPFGSLVEYYPISAKDQSRIHQFGKKVLPGLFLGYALYAGGIWKGDIMVADIEELETIDASEIYSKRLNAKEVIFPKQNGKFIFPVADGRIKFVGGDQELRTSTLIRDHPIRGEGQRDFLGESEGSPPPSPQDSYPDAGEATNDFWSMSGNFIYRHHVEPRVKLYSPREESFPIPMKCIDVSRTTHTNLDVMQESRIDDCWNIDGSRDLSDSWTGFTQFTLLSEKPPDGYMWSGRD